MRILFLMPSLTGGGAERQTAYLAAELQRRGHDVLTSFIYRGRGEWPDELLLHPLPESRPWSPRLVLDLVRLIRAWKPDVVQTSLPRMDVAGGIASTLTRVPFVLREPNSAASYRGLKSLLRAVVGRRATAIVANSAAGAAYWRRGQVFTVPNAVPLEEVERAQPVERPPHAAIATYTGRLVPEKNVDVLLQAAALVMKERDLFLFICGTGPEQPRLEALARELGIERRVRFTGFVTNAWSYQRSADVALLLSDFEGHPNAISECFAGGTPMILSDIASHRGLAGAEALFVPPRDVAATAVAIGNVLDDHAAASARAERARKTLRTSSVAEMASSYENVLAIAAAEVV